MSTHARAYRVSGQKQARPVAPERESRAVEPFPERYERLKEVLKSAPPNVKLVPVVVCHDEAEVLALLAQYLTEGCECVMIRSREGGYALGNRSLGLLKYKKFIEDRELVIVDVIEDKGSEEGCAIYVSQTPENREFNVRPMGDVTRRRVRRPREPHWPWN